MTISERVFERIQQMGMTQKAFSEKTGILQSTISEWKKKKTNPSSDKIMLICEALDVEPEWLLSGIDAAGSRSQTQDYYMIKKDTEIGRLISCYNRLDAACRNRVISYMEAFDSLRERTEDNG